MHKGAPIPANVGYDDPLWAGRFSDLANEMILLGAKPKMVANYTGLNPKVVSDRYRRLTGQEPPGGRMSQAQPKFFVSRTNGYEFMLQAAIFAKVYLKLEAAMGEPVHAGWLLVTAYQAYLRRTEEVASGTSRINPLTISNAYDLMIHVGFRRRNLTAIQVKDCSDCGSPYLVAIEVEKDECVCPLCALQARQEQLALNLDRATNRKHAFQASA